MADRSQKLTRRQQRLAEKGTDRGVAKFPSINQLNLQLNYITPITENQIAVFKAFDQGDNLCLIGCAGTGKTFITVYKGLEEIGERSSPYRKLVIIRTPQASKDIGFLPGTEKQKIEVYEAPYRAICTELYGRGDAYDMLKQKQLIEFHGTSFLRGTTIDDAIILIDEAQNMRWQELRTIMTRVGQNSRVIICGDMRQDDLTSERYHETSGLPTLIKVLEKMNEISTIHFDVEDIVRSGFVKDFIQTEYELGLY